MMDYVMSTHIQAKLSSVCAVVDICFINYLIFPVCAVSMSFFFSVAFYVCFIT